MAQLLFHAERAKEQRPQRKHHWINHPFGYTRYVYIENTVAEATVVKVLNQSRILRDGKLR